MAAGGLAAALSTADGLLLTISNALSHDIYYKMIDKQTAIQNELVEGAYVTQVIKGSPAEKSNLQEEDIITEINGQTVSGLDEQSLYNLIIALKPGAQINLKVWRNKEIKIIYVII